MPNVAKMMEIVLNLRIEGILNFLQETNVFLPTFVQHHLHYYSVSLHFFPNETCLY